jgi:hypothetical protein
MTNDSETNVDITLSRAESLVLFEFLSRFSKTEKLVIEHAAEERVLWDICAVLEEKLVEPFEEDYDSILQTARGSLVTEE